MQFDWVSLKMFLNGMSRFNPILTNQLALNQFGC